MASDDNFSAGTDGRGGAWDTVANMDADVKGGLSFICTFWLVELVFVGIVAIG